MDRLSKLSDRERILGDEYKRKGTVPTKLLMGGIGISSGLSAGRSVLGILNHKKSGDSGVDHLNRQGYRTGLISDLGNAGAGSYVLGSTIRNRMRNHERENREDLSKSDITRLKAIEDERFRENALKGLMLGAGANIGLGVANKVAARNYLSKKKSPGLSNNAALLLGLGGGLAAGAGGIYAYNKSKRLKEDRLVRDTLDKERKLIEEYKRRSL